MENFVTNANKNAFFHLKYRTVRLKFIYNALKITTEMLHYYYYEILR